MQALTQKEKIGLLGFGTFTAIAAFAMWFTLNIGGQGYSDPGFARAYWPFEVVLAGLSLFFAWKWFGWKEVGFRQLKRDQLIWFAPALLNLAIMLGLVGYGVLTRSLDGAAWTQLGIVAGLTLLVGIAEEVMFRGVVLHAFLEKRSPRVAIIISAVTFSLIHSINIFGGLPFASMPTQLALTFIFGLFTAPLLLRLNSLVPLIIFHWFWDMTVFTAQTVGIETISLFSSAGIIINLVMGIWLFSKTHNRPKISGEYSAA